MTKPDPLRLNTPTPQPAAYDAVKKVQHYQNVPGIECKDVIGWFPGFVACAIKYLWRCGYKPDTDPIQDLRKAIEFIEYEIERLESMKK